MLLEGAQVVGRLHDHVPTLGSSLFGFYDVIQIDEVQDLTHAGKGSRRSPDEGGL